MFTWPRIRSRFVANLFLITPTLEPRLDESFYEDEGQLAAELATQLPDGLVTQPLPEVDLDEFEKLYIWFLS